MKISNLIQEEIKLRISFRKKLRITHVRDRNLTEGRIYPKAEFSKCGLNTRHDNREVTLTHLTEALTNRPPAQSSGSMTIKLFHANCSAAQVYHTNGSMTINVIPSLFCRSRLCLASSSFQAADDDQFCRYFFPLSAKKGF